MKQIKRLTALCIVLALALTMSIGAFADGSPSAYGLFMGARARMGNGRMVNVTLSEVTDDNAKVKLEDSDFLKEAIGNEYVEGMVLADLKGLTLPEDVEFPVTLELDVNGVKAGSKIALLYFDGTEWKKATIESIADGLVAVTFESNPTMIALIMDETEMAAANIGTTSPKTGMSPIVMMAAFGAVVCITGAVTLTKKKEHN